MNEGGRESGSRKKKSMKYTEKIVGNPYITCKHFSQKYVRKRGQLGCYFSDLEFRNKR